MIKLPVSFKEFLKKPMLAITYLLICGVVGLYIEGKVTERGNEKKWQKRIIDLEKKCSENELRARFEIDAMRVGKERSDSIMNRLSATMEVLKKLGQIKID